MPYRHIFPIYALWWMEFMTIFLKNTLASQPYSNLLQANCFSVAECYRILLDGHIRQLSKGFQATIPDGTRVGKNFSIESQLSNLIHFQRTGERYRQAISHSNWTSLKLSLVPLWKLQVMSCWNLWVGSNIWVEHANLLVKCVIFRS